MGYWSLQFNVDGMQLYQKANIWHLVYSCNDKWTSFCEKERKYNDVGLRFGFQKPKLQTNLKPFVDELKVVSEKGLEWKNNGKIFFTTVFPLIYTADAPARTMLQNFMQYNRKYGCGFCENKGKGVEKGREVRHIYKALNPSPDSRTLNG